MKKRFIVCHQPGTKDQDDAFKNWLNSREVGWWHWISGSWVVIDLSGALTVDEIRDNVQASYVDKYCMVFEHDSNRYAGAGPNDDAQRKRMGDWIANNWKS
jgi:hypothetical protein